MTDYSKPSSSSSDENLGDYSIELNLQTSNLSVQELNACTDWHSISDDQFFQRLETNLSGLSSDEHIRILAKHGPNSISVIPSVSIYVKFLFNLVGGFQLMLIFGAFLCFIVFGITNATDVQTLALGVVLIIVVISTAIFQTYQEGKSDEVMAALKALTPTTVYAFRDNQLSQVPAESLVPGDVVKVVGGEKVPADVRIFSASDLKVNNASLTGENVDIKLGIEPKHNELYEAKNIARCGCNFTSGSGIGIVFATGDNTFFGSIANATTVIQRPPSLLTHEIHRLIKIMAFVAFVLGGSFFILALVNGYSWLEAVVFMIGIVVANVPEGLLPQMTLALTLTAQRMLKSGVVVSNLDIIETLGAVDVICSDKTGTLTCNRMSVSHVVYNGSITITPISPQIEGDKFGLFDSDDAHFKMLQKIASLNSDTVFLQSEEEEPDVLKRETKGDASESAIIKFFEPLRSIAEYRASCKRQVSIPFNSTNKWMLSINEQEGDASLPLLLMVKGAPEKVLNMCTHIFQQNSKIEMNTAIRNSIESTNETLASRGERVLAFAYLELPRSQYPSGYVFDADMSPPNFPTSGLTLVGLISLIDPPRMSVKPSIAQCNTAGIKVFMVTGDHPITAHAIAKSLNLITLPTREEVMKKNGFLDATYDEYGAIVVHGSEMLKFNQDDWTRVLKHKQIVFARTMPQQKQDIVRELNKIGNIVAMTGDGVNDAPALKASNVGIAMGSGAAVAKEASQLILLNDDFSAIVEGIREGRLIFENLKKCICYVLASNVPEIVPFLLFISMQIPLAIETVAILFIDIGTDLAPAVSLAYEEPEDAIMENPPRTEHAHLVGPQMMIIAYLTIGVFETLAAFVVFFVALGDDGFSLNQLIGAGPEWRFRYNDLSDDRKDFFTELCLENDVYSATGGNCEDDFHEYRNSALNRAQAAYFIAVVWGQIANVLINKTQLVTIFSWSRMFDNTYLIYSILLEIALVFFLVYTPGLNSVFQFEGPAAIHVFYTIWVIPLILIWDETRKWICRSYPNGLFKKYFYF